MTLVGPGTWEAARAAVDVALTAVDLVAAGAPTAYALCRPPGHHATPPGYGGSCYLNNAAVAAEALRDAGHDRVAVVDIDAHHGNGTQAIFWERPDVLYGSLHVDPGAGWFPHLFGHAAETGVRGRGGSDAQPPAARGDRRRPLGRRRRRSRRVGGAAGCTALVVSLGVDAAGDDPESPLQVTADGFRAAGRVLGGLDLPSVLVQEGGYHLETMGGLVAAYLAGHAGAERPAGLRAAAWKTGRMDRVAAAFDAVPRVDFLPRRERRRAAYDGPLAIGHGQTNSQPRTVDDMLRLLDVQPGQRVLDVGAGSGWSTALLAQLHR